MGRALSTILTFVLILAITSLSCGGDKQEQTADNPGSSEQIDKETTADDRPSDKPESDTEALIARNPNVKPEEFKQPEVRTSSEVFPEDLKKNTPEYAAYWFAEYFTSGDSANAYTFCTDSMKEVVRMILQEPGKIDDMRRNRAAGYTLISTSKALDSCDSKECSVCIKAKYFGETREECNFRFRKTDGEWKLYRFGKW